jgi:hypothetical protein
LHQEHLWAANSKRRLRGSAPEFLPTAAGGTDFRGHQVRTVGGIERIYIRIAQAQSGEGSRNCGAFADWVLKACGRALLHYKVPEIKRLLKELYFLEIGMEPWDTNLH